MAAAGGGGGAFVATATGDGEGKVDGDGDADGVGEAIVVGEADGDEAIGEFLAGCCWLEAETLSEGDGVGSDSATARADLGVGYAAFRAIPLPHEPRNSTAATTEVAAINPRRIASRTPRGMANKIAAESMISAVPTVLGAA